MKLSYIFVCFILFIVYGCSSIEKKNNNDLPEQFLLISGTAQDAGYPQIGCEKECCNAYWQGKEEKKLVTCLMLVDRTDHKYWMIEATPDITEQLQNVQSYLPAKPDYSPDGIFITHAHIGHYSGLMQFGREAMGTSNIPVYAMPRLDSFLRNNGPWSQLVKLNNITLKLLQEDERVVLNEHINIIAFTVPHRDEYSETVGFKIESKNKKILFIPDIDKWQKWDKEIISEIKKVDIALLDGTFYKNGELPGRSMNEVPHPFVEESMNLFADLPLAEKAKIRFIHFNHTNPLIKKKSAEKDKVIKDGFGVCEQGMLIPL